MKKVLSIETSCDDTSLSIVCFNDNFVYPEKLISYSQIKNHQKYGGVVPEIASRLHNEKILLLLEEVGLDLIYKVDDIVVTSNPGLPGSLIVGKTLANTIGYFFKKNVVEENHINGHIFSIFLERKISDIKLPAIFISVSGGHNDIYLLKNENNIFKLEHLGKTIDDAAGECFDKASRMLGGPYPGGPWIAKMAEGGRENLDFKLFPTFLKKNKFDFSFSGLKSKLYYLLKDFEKNGISLSYQTKKDICYNLQKSIIVVLTNKLLKAAEKYNVKSVCLVGGVLANDMFFSYVQKKIHEKSLGLEVFRPIKKIYSTDNAAMIGASYLIKNYY